MAEHHDEHGMTHFRSPRLTPTIPYGAIMQAVIYVVGLAIAGTVVVLEMRGQQATMLERMNASQKRFESNLDSMHEDFQARLTSQVDLMTARVDLLRAELEGQIAANEARIGNQERLLSADIARILEKLDELTRRLEEQDTRARRRTPQ